MCVFFKDVTRVKFTLRNILKLFSHYILHETPMKLVALYTTKRQV